MKNKVKEVFEWDYNIPEKYKSFIELQKDWNQTLMTMINKMAATRVKYYFDLDEKRINSPLKIPLHFQKLISTLEYYNKKTQTLANREIIFITTAVNYIELDGFKLKILNYKEKNMKDRKSVV